jgi:ABC-2 type transport system permease protein
MTSIWAIAWKDLRLLIRDRYGLFWVLAFPMMTALFFGSIFKVGGAPNKINLAIIDDDQSKTSAGLIDRLRKSDSINIRRYVAETVQDNPEPITLSKAEELVRKGKIAAFLHVKKGFDNGSGMFFDSSKLELATDPSRGAECGMLEGVVMQNVFMGFTETFSNPKVGREQIAKAKEQLAGAKDISVAQSVVLGALFTSLDSFFAQQEAEAKEGDGKGGLNNSPFSNMKLAVRDVSSGDVKRVLSGYEITFPQAIAWAFMGICISFAVSTVQERTLGTLMRLRVAPISSAHIMLGKGLACFITMLTVSTLLLVVGRLIFGVRIADPLNLAFGLLSAGVAFVGLMTFIASTGKTERAVAGSATAYGMLLAMLGGAAVPTFVMPQFMLTLSNISPFKWLIYSVEGGIWRGFTVTEMLIPCGILLAFGAFFFIIAVVNSRYTQRA